MEYVVWPPVKRRRCSRTAVGLSADNSCLLRHDCDFRKDSQVRSIIDWHVPCTHTHIHPHEHTHIVQHCPAVIAHADNSTSWEFQQFVCDYLLPLQWGKELRSDSNTNTNTTNNSNSNNTNNIMWRLTNVRNIMYTIWSTNQLYPVIGLILIYLNKSVNCQNICWKIL